MRARLRQGRAGGGVGRDAAGGTVGWTPLGSGLLWREVESHLRLRSPWRSGVMPAFRRIPATASERSSAEARVHLSSPGVCYDCH